MGVGGEFWFEVVGEEEGGGRGVVGVEGRVWKCLGDVWEGGWEGDNVFWGERGGRVVLSGPFHWGEEGEYSGDSGAKGSSMIGG